LGSRSPQRTVGIEKKEEEEEEKKKKKKKKKKKNKKKMMMMMNKHMNMNIFAHFLTVCER